MAIEYTEVRPAPVPDHATSYDVRMRDGVMLATEHYRSGEESDRGPTILIRLPYDKDGEYTFLPLIAEYMTARGYHVVAQDVRGKFRSGGETLLFVNEVYDGYDTIEWIIQQPWSDGTVAMWGDSYYGYTQWAAVSSAHPALKAIAPRVTGTGLGEYPLPLPGARTRDVEMAIILLYPLTYFHSANTFHWEPDWTRRPYGRDLEAFQEQIGKRSPSYDLWYPHPVSVRRFPNGSPFDAPPIPVLHTIGWWDNCGPWAWRDHDEIVKRPAWEHNTYLLIESVDHENYELGSTNDPVERSDEETRAMFPRYLDPALEFFDAFVRGKAGAARIPKVRWNLSHTAGYRVADHWPPADLEMLALYPTMQGTLNPTVSERVTTAQWRHDPDDLVPSTVPNAFAYLQTMPDERSLSARPDVLTFATSAYPHDENLVGPIRLQACVSSSGPTMDVFARLYDVAPDGTHTRIARGQVHVLNAETDTDVSIDLGHVGYLLHAGHMLRLLVCSSDFPEFIPQPGTGDDPWTAVDVKPNTQQIRLGGSAAAVLTLHTLASTGPAYDQTGRIP
jgi:putative CocE/NonD family hydrolase